LLAANFDLLSAFNLFILVSLDLRKIFKVKKHVENIETLQEKIKEPLKEKIKDQKKYIVEEKIPAL